MNIKRFIACITVALSASAFADGATYWVDDDGVDANTGTAPTLTGETTPGGQPIGPKQSLKAGLGLAVSGDVVCVLPGHYRDGVMTNAADKGYWARAVVPAGVKLVSRDGRDVTFIHGAEATTPVPETRTAGQIACGLGPDAVRCVVLTGSGSVFGFTLADGHCRTNEDGYGYGGGVRLLGSGCAVACVITNCFAMRGGAAYSGTRTAGLVNSVVTDCHSVSPGAGAYIVGAWNCVFRNFSGSYSTYALYCANCYNCTLKSQLAANSTKTFGWNTVLTAGDTSYLVMTNSYTSAAGDANSDWSSPDNKTSLNANTNLLTDAADMPVKGKHLGIDMARWDYYTNCFPAVAADYMGKDAYGRSRVVNGAMDDSGIRYIRRVVRGDGQPFG